MSRFFAYKTGLSTLYLWVKGQGFEKVLEAVAEEDGPDFWEVIDEGVHELESARVRALTELATVGKRVAVHGPIYSWEYANLATERGRRDLLRMKRSVEASAEAEAVYWVFHPPLKRKVSMELVDDSIIRLYDYAHSVGLRAVLENPFGVDYALYKAEDFSEFYRRTSCDLPLAFDTGHAYIEGELEGFLNLVSKFGVVHASDNHGREDEHLAVGDGSVPWDRVISVLREAEFYGEFTVESVDKPRESVERLKRFLTAARRWAPPFPGTELESP